jgi:peptidoglycan/xylan/chitin deacetylase (PgdA/CDA1 family)
MNLSIKIFLFHRISPIRDLLWDPISPELFSRTIRYIKHKYEVISLDNILMEDVSTVRFNKPLCAIVFDDGYRDFINYALPILKKNNCTSSMYVVTDCVDKKIPPWTYVLDFHLLNSSMLELRLNESLLPKNLRKTKFANKNERLDFAKRIKPYLKTIRNTDREELYHQIIASLRDVEIPLDLMMSWDEIRYIKGEGVEIGSHSKTHPLLGKIDSKTDLVTEIKGSGNIIKEQLGFFPKSISYPNGSYTETVKDIAKESGFNAGLVVNQRTYNNSRHDQFEVPRIELYNEGLLKTKLRIEGIIQKINSVLKR